MPLQNQMSWLIKNIANSSLAINKFFAEVFSKKNGHKIC